MTAEEERAAVVAWLRRQSKADAEYARDAKENIPGWVVFSGTSFALYRAAEAIERLDHHASKEGKGP